jgi:hypothetical protein
MKQLISRQYPTNRLLNPAFQYKHSSLTDLRETFARYTGVINERSDSSLSLQPESRQITQSSSRLCLDSLET